MHWALVGLGMYYALLALSIAGTVVLRRRRVPSFPLWAIGLDVVCSVRPHLRPDPLPDHLRGVTGAAGRRHARRLWSALRSGRRGRPGGRVRSSAARPLDPSPASASTNPRLTP